MSKNRNKSNCALKRFKLEQLEPRTLYSADPISAGLHTVPESFEELPFEDLLFDDPSSNELAESLPAESSGTHQIRSEIIFIDTTTPDYLLLVQDLLANQSAVRTFEIITIDANDHGIQVISDTLDTHSNILLAQTTQQ